MVTKNNLAPELKRLFKYMQETLSAEYPNHNISVEYFIIAALNDEKSIAYQILDKTMLNEKRETLKNDLISYIKEESRNYGNNNTVTKFDDVFDKYIEDLRFVVTGKINSGHILLSIIKNNRTIKNSFNLLGITPKQISDALTSISNKEEKNVIKKGKKNNNNNYRPQGPTDEYVPPMPEMLGKSPMLNYIGNEDLIQTIFVALSKYNFNNVLLIGERGVGKTCLVRQIATMIFEGNVPEAFKDHIIVNFKEGLGSLMQHFKEIMNDAQERGNYIFFVPDIDLLIYDGSPYVDMVKQIMSNRRISVIATTIEERYNRVDADKHFPKFFRKIEVKQKTEEETIEILRENKKIYEEFHGVTYDDEIIEQCVRLSKKYLPNAVLPQSAIDVFDEIGAMAGLNKIVDGKLFELENKLNHIRSSKEKCAENHLDELYQTLSKNEISIKSEIEKRKKEISLENNRENVEMTDLYKVITSLSKLPVTKINEDEKTKLVNLYDSIKKRVIGQDNAVSEVVKTVKRQRIGLGKQGKPSVMMFVGNSGTGKTYLAKTLAKELFGDEKAFVRIDMSEYNDKTSVNKIYGSSAGYVGYENGGILTEAVKKNRHCVLLLDEIEKASDEVHDVFLQLFDDGRLTDNKGVTVDFSNCIIIMTSNIGTKEALLRGKGVGFTNNGRFSAEIIDNEIKKRFKPEFVNRIDNIIMFNKLSNDDIKEIIRLELNDLNERLNNIGFNMNDNFIELASDYIFEEMSKEANGDNYGARPVVRLIRNDIENRITEFIINEDPPKGYEISFEEIMEY